MHPQQPPSPLITWPVCPASLSCTERLAAMVKTADEIAIGISLGGRPATASGIAELLAALRLVVPALARERNGGQTMARCMLEGVADKLQATADRRGFWPRHAGNRPPESHEMQLRALIARLRVVARN